MEPSAASLLLAFWFLLFPPPIHAQTSASWPHYLLLEITFDANPSQTAWKFTNARSTDVLASTAFGDYAAYEEGQTVKERIDILTEEDLDGDPLVEGAVREYSFVIYDEVRQENEKERER